MKATKVFFLAGYLAAATLVSWISINKYSKNIDKNSIANKGFAVVELFTSEGCSSCPPADELAEKIQKESNNLPVYILSFHVDYWNRLGWKDVFSDAAYSKRQNQYAQWLNLQSIYTPQIVVNGSKEFIGSEEGILRNAIKSNLQKPSSAALSLNDLKVGKDQLNFKYNVENQPEKSSLLIALVQKSSSIDVKSGENGGRTLSHVQIVRNLQTVSLDGKTNGNASINIPANLNHQNLEIIAFLQNQNNGTISAAAKIGLNQSMAVLSSSSK